MCKLLVFHKSSIRTRVNMVLKCHGAVATYFINTARTFILRATFLFDIQPLFYHSVHQKVFLLF